MTEGDTNHYLDTRIYISPGPVNAVADSGSRSIFVASGIAEVMVALMEMLAASQ